MTVLLEAPGVALAMSPEHGAKITSLRDTIAHREWFEQPRGDLADLDPSARLSTVRMIDARGTSLTMSWRLDELAYLGVWLDHGHLSQHPVLSIEPTNGFGDSLQRCVDRSSIAPTPGHTSRTWTISVQLANRSVVGFESPHDDKERQ